MELNVKDPVTYAGLLFDAKPMHLHGIHGFYLRHPNGSGFYVANRGGAWRIMDDHHVEPQLLVNIGLALEGYDWSEQVDLKEGKTV
jgi:hypothetical protein